jgi:hypothetical protein
MGMGKDIPAKSMLMKSILKDVKRLVVVEVEVGTREVEARRVPKELEVRIYNTVLERSVVEDEERRISSTKWSQ